MTATSAHAEDANRPAPKAVLFDTFGTVVDWRSSLIRQFEVFAGETGVAGNWAAVADAWRREYAPSMNRVRVGASPWKTLDQLHRESLATVLSELGIAGVRPDDLDRLSLAWHRLSPWPDAVEGLQRLKRRYVIGPLSNGNVALLVNMAKFAQLPWDVVPGSDIFRHYKPDPEIYLGVCDLLSLAPHDVMLAAAHGSDLAAARSCGLQTAYFPRPLEYGGPGARPLDPGSAVQQDWDILASDIEDLATQLGA